MGIRTDGSRPVTPAGRAEATPVGINLGTGAVLAVAATMAASAVPAGAPAARSGVVALGVGLAAAVTVDPLALPGVAALGWLFADGFLENRAGTLSWHGSADRHLLTLLAVAGVAGLLVGHGYRRAGRLIAGRRGGPGAAAIPGQPRRWGSDGG